ncbi:MAG: hypothetical protein GTN99_02970 [Candidatus Dadabacteria bacterium]|nr:hypothetical protein [Candidatus Dadabacteria bacterium]
MAADEEQLRQLEADLITKIISAVDVHLKKSMAMDEVHHKHHHEYIEILIEKERKKAALRESIKKQVLGWGVITMLSGIGYFGYKLIEYWVRHNVP